MPMPYKTRRRLSALVLIVLLPVYIAFAWWLMSLFERPPILLELLVYVALGVAWALPLRQVFLGVGQADPDAGRGD
ncbi:uncharacterized protein DUF2842 [Hasllibacter halocynthiae]|uniref:Uncharacterized protein DUF2842 n=1 Tax=Hasllibacter halocynthiae TaxID=595589 RepID=A0A2T0X729_9RHOB|nr:DUF2842 domain-containing protein [Hasllibacter halocynthiae]PRY94695.1 uncharacterized protein DUF2842 [Hasllibacter halocynthiae]